MQRSVPRGIHGMGEEALCWAQFFTALKVASVASSMII
jgi:hypothetical protein